MADIVVTAKRYDDSFQNSWFWRDWMGSGFDNYYTLHPGGGGGGGSGGSNPTTIEAASPSTTSDYEIPAKGDIPKILLRNITKEQFNDFMSMYNNLKYDLELKAEFKAQADNNNTVRITISDTLPANADPTGRATISFSIYQASFDSPRQSVQPNSTIEIVVKASAITSTGTWEDTFKGIVAHEFTHFKRDSTGRFLQDHYSDGYKGQKTTDEDDATYNNLLNKMVGASYSDSMDVTQSIDPTYSFPTFTGTNGNNFINMAATDISQGLAVAYTGAGNDMIIGTNLVWDSMVANGAGRKVIVQEGDGVDLLNWMTLDTISKMVVTYSGGDTYLTSSDSQYQPIDDPNAIVIIGMTQGNITNAVEIVSAADGTAFYFHSIFASRANAVQVDMNVFEAAINADGEAKIEIAPVDMNVFEAAINAGRDSHVNVLLEAPVEVWL